MGSKQKKRKIKLPYGTVAEVARRLHTQGKSITVQGVWERIHLAEDPKYLALAAEVVEERKQQKEQARKNLNNAIASI